MNLDPIVTSLPPVANASALDSRYGRDRNISPSTRAYKRRRAPRRMLVRDIIRPRICGTSGLAIQSGEILTLPMECCTPNIAMCSKRASVSSGSVRSLLGVAPRRAWPSGRDCCPESGDVEDGFVSRTFATAPKYPIRYNRYVLPNSYNRGFVCHVFVRTTLILGSLFVIFCPIPIIVASFDQFSVPIDWSLVIQSLLRFDGSDRPAAGGISVITSAHNVSS